MLVLEKITHQFRDNLALKDISGTVDNGEVVAVIGENGSGKSTLLSVIATFIKPTSGKIYYNNIDVFQSTKNVNNYRRYITYASEKVNFISELSLKDNLLYFKNLFNSKKDVFEISKQVGIYDLLNQKPNSLSKGQKQRLSLAVSLLKEAYIVLLDEPAEGLDVETKNVVKEIVKKLKQNDCMVFYVTHDEDEIEEVCDKIITLKEGTLKFFGSVEEFWNIYEKFYVVTYEQSGRKITKVLNIESLKSLQEQSDIRILHIRNLGLREIINMSETDGVSTTRFNEG
ncbi:ABC transporter ATP-binding protein [Fervidobacterium sp.]